MKETPKNRGISRDQFAESIGTVSQRKRWKGSDFPDIMREAYAAGKLTKPKKPQPVISICERCHSDVKLCRYVGEGFCDMCKEYKHGTAAKWNATDAAKSYYASL